MRSDTTSYCAEFEERVALESRAGVQLEGYTPGTFKFTDHGSSTITIGRQRLAESPRTILFSMTLPIRDRAAASESDDRLRASKTSQFAKTGSIVLNVSSVFRKFVPITAGVSVRPPNQNE